MIKHLKKFINNINKKKFKRTFFSSIVIFLLIIIISSIGFTYARYESDTTLKLNPNIAFFIVEATNTTKSLELTKMVPSNDYYDYYFEVSNFNDTGKANVDLNYNIQLKMTTNLPLTYEIYKVEDNTMANINTVNISTNQDGMYFKEYVDTNDYFMACKTKKTDRFLLRVYFPLEYKNNPDYYESVIDLVEININATQVV
mgnify:FL=1